MSNERKHFALGLISLLITIFSWALISVIILIVRYYEELMPGGIEAVGEDSSAVIIMGILFLISMPLNFVGLILGAVGLFDKDRNKLLCILGVIFSLSLFALMLTGAIANKAMD